VHLERLTGVIGAQVTDIDLRNLSQSQAETLRIAICDYSVLVIPDQYLSPTEQATFSHLLGPYSPVPFVQPIHEHPEVIRVVKEASDKEEFNFGGVWHSDFSFLPTPPAFTILQAVEVPKVGGDTVWSSMTAAHDALQDDMRSQLEKITALHSASDAYSPNQQARHSQLSGMDIRTSNSAKKRTRHPLLCTHPENGRRNLFFNRLYVRGLEGPELSGPRKSKRERQLLDWLHEWTTQIRFTVRHRWSNGDICIWDNRSTQHLAINDYPGQRRELTRTTVAGSPPSP